MQKFKESFRANTPIEIAQLQPAPRSASAGKRKRRSKSRGRLCHHLLPGRRGARARPPSLLPCAHGTRATVSLMDRLGGGLGHCACAPGCRAKVSEPSRLSANGDVSSAFQWLRRFAVLYGKCPSRGLSRADALSVEAGVILGMAREAECSHAGTLRLGSPARFQLILSQPEECGGQGQELCKLL